MKETIFKERNTLRFHIFMILCVGTLLFFLLFIIINSIVAKRVFLYSKTKSSFEIINELNNFFDDEPDSTLDQNMRFAEVKNNIEIVIEDNQNNIIYSSNYEIEKIINEFSNFAEGKILYSEDNTIVIEEKEDKNTECCIIKSKLDNGNIVYIRISYTAIQANIKISNKIMIGVGLVLFIIASFLSLLTSESISRPIASLTKITGKMAQLDFSEKYRINDSNYEINQLGKNINNVSDKLEETINELKEHNIKLQSDIEEKSEIDKMRKQFISDVSHELKTPIGLIQGYSEGLIENVNEDEKSRKFYAEVIRDEAQKMDILVKKLLELMKIEYKEKAFKDVEFNISELIREEIRRETVIIKNKDIDLIFDGPEKLIVYADQDCIEQVVNNYLSNAIKHCERIKNENKIRIRTEKTKNGKVRLFVYNSEKKIPKDYQNKIWGRFYKMDKSRNRDDGSTGLGLALVKAIMNNYGNEFGVRNVGNGVEFYCDINIKKE